MRRGKFIVFEGLDGAGTTTQCQRLAEWMRAQGREVHETAEPSDGPIGRMIRQVLREEQLGADSQRMNAQSIAGLFVADRADHLKSEIEPALARGVDVLCDRYVHSSLAYQGSETDVDWVASLNSVMPSPDLILFVEVPVAVAGERRRIRDEQAEIYEADIFQKKVAEGYLRAQMIRPEDPVSTIDGAQSVEDVQDDIRRVISDRLGVILGSTP